MRRFISSLHQALKAVRAFKLRAVFCIASVALGISAITVIVAATEGAYRRAYEMVDRFGPDAMLVLGGSAEARAIGRRDKTITVQDVEALRQAFPTAYLLVPMSSVREVNISYGNRRHQTRVTGTTEGYSRSWSWPVVDGRDLSEADVKGMRNVALIGAQVARELFANTDPIGKFFFVRNVAVRVVGVLEERGTTGAGHNLDDRIVMPITTAMKKLMNEKTYVNAVRIRFLDARNMGRYRQEVRAFLRQRHGLKPGQPDDFRLLSSEEIIRFLVALTGSLVIFIGITGVMALVVAGFVLANLFLLSVSERSGEIGIRRAVGARRRDILFQFLLEAIALTLVGGLLGFVLGVAAGPLLKLAADFPIYFSWKAFAAGLILSMLVGLIFGLQPARRAAAVHPIQAIRSG
ncbi:putative ABC transport system permease protein [Desulfacinum hydrothermale DSM 13146]|uniref:Putative ABC transport system permease protein n=1 Tax=Desulfacinum hydrothermale DSM 13146 TaxID=1121390 RepID=A0A1W1XEB0_9BACT|nr:ABC transporter permease [Desulfacinum hydrothermale]SMC21978.1 putative ABC transport system permease protein [Desulfacinum hydrothermale DSM 13146]